MIDTASRVWRPFVLTAQIYRSDGLEEKKQDNKKIRSVCSVGKGEAALPLKISEASLLFSIGKTVKSFPDSGQQRPLLDGRDFKECLCGYD